MNQPRERAHRDTPDQAGGADDPSSGKPARRRRGRKILFWTFLIVLAIICGAASELYHRVTDPKSVRAMAERFLESVFTGDVSVEYAEFSTQNGIVLQHVQVFDPQALPTDWPAMTMGRMALQCDWWAFLKGHVEVDHIEVTDALCRAVFSDTDERFNLQRLFRHRPRARKGPPGRLPRVTIEGARLAVVRRRDGRDEPVEHIRLDLSAEPKADAPRAYAIRWKSAGAAEANGRCLLDLADGTLVNQSGGAPWLSLEAAMMVVQASSPSAGRWVQLLGVKGVFRIADFSLALGVQPQHARRMTLEFEDATVSIPLLPAEYEYTGDDRYLYLTHVAGQMVIDPEAAHAEFDGSLRGSRCRLSADFHGETMDTRTLRDLGFEIELSASDLTLPRDDADADPAARRLVRRWARLGKVLSVYNPRGKVDLTVALGKPAGRDAPIELRRVVLTGRNAEASLKYFPYRVTDLTGSVEITPDGVFFRGLTGRHNTAEILIDGWLDSTASDCAAEVYVSGRNVPLDDALCSALDQRYQEIWRRFSPTGLTDLEVVLHRPRGNGRAAPWTTLVDAELTSVDAKFDGFPYLLTDLSGSVTIGQSTMRIDNLRGNADGGIVAASGVARLGGVDGNALALVLEAADVPISDRLIAALPDDQRNGVQSFSPTGRVVLTCKLDQDRGDSQLQYDIDLALEDGTVQRQKLPVPIDQVEGSLHVSRRGVDEIDLTGKRGGGHLHVTGSQLAKDAGERSELTVQADRVRFNEKLRAALPEDTQEVLRDWQLDGDFDVVATVTPDGSQTTGGGMSVAVDLSGMRVAHRSIKQVVQLDRGTLNVRGSRVELSGVEGGWDKSRIRAAAIADTTATGRRFDLKLRLDNVQLDDNLAEKMPDDVAGIWRSIKPTGDLASARLDLHRTQRADSDEPVWDISGKLALTGVDADLGLSIGDIRGELAFSGQAQGRLRDAVLIGTAKLARARVGKDLLTDAAAQVLRDGPNRRWLVRDVTASAYGGQVYGQVEVNLQQPAPDYQLRVAASELDLDAMLDARREEQRSPEDELSGTVDAKFFITGLLDQPGARRGGGTVSIDQARLFRIPLLLAVVQALNLAVPSDSKLQRADADFVMEGDRLTLNPLRIGGPGLALAGDGSMMLSSRQLDLRLASVSPNRAIEVPVLSELVNGTSRELMEVIVRGTPEDPRISSQPLRSVAEALGKLKRRDRRE